MEISLQFGVPFSGSPSRRTIVYWGLCWGPLILGNDHMQEKSDLCCMLRHEEDVIALADAVIDEGAVVVIAHDTVVAIRALGEKDAGAGFHGLRGPVLRCILF